MELVQAAQEIEPSLNIRLLADLRTIFESGEHNGTGHLATKTILAHLCLLENAPWSYLKGKPITDNQLARRLKQYEVKSKTLRLEGNVFAKGYARADLHDVWRRYLPPLSDEPVAQAPRDIGEAGETSQASKEPSQASHRTIAATPMTPGDAAADPRYRQRMGVVSDVTPVTLFGENKRGPSPKEREVDAANIEPSPPSRRRMTI